MRKFVIFLLIFLSILIMQSTVNAKQSKIFTPEESLSCFFENIESVNQLASDMGYDWNYNDFDVFPIDNYLN
ncbi:MAG: hypothetical protein PQJ44_02985 [Sphaerochaetaceae bacterium]|nr:hypothetical protein [Sphaerochaetaceae bacterium]